jgi:hypothetical protein
MTGLKHGDQGFEGNGAGLAAVLGVEPVHDYRKDYREGAKAHSASSVRNQNILPRRREAREVARRRKQDLISTSRNFASFAPSR